MPRFYVDLNDEERDQLMFVCQVLRSNPRSFLRSTIPAHFQAVREMIRNGVLQGEASATDQETAPAEYIEPAAGGADTDAPAPESDQDRAAPPSSGGGEGSAT